MDETVEVRLLGTLSVRRADGSFVESREWRTGKTAELLRLLALAGGRAVPTAVLLDRLWPDVPEERGRASLRTAASQIRRTVGADCLERLPEGLRLADVWVDVQAFRTLAREARVLAAGRAHHRVVALAREGVVLYGGDLMEGQGAHEEWLTDARDQLALEHLEMLVEAAASADALGWFAEAVDFAQAARQCDPLAEPAHRALMTAYQGLGDLARSLRVYEELRHDLVEELGVDPSPETQALHLELLCGGQESPPGAARVAPHPRQVEELRWLVDGAASRRAVVALTGPEGVGRCQVAAAAVRELCADGWRVFPALLGQDLERASQDWLPEDRTIVVFSQRDLPVEAVRVALDLPDCRGTVVALVARPELLSGRVSSLEDAGCPVLVMPVSPLTSEEVRAVVTTALRAPLSEEALERLVDSTGGLLSPVEEQVGRWVAEGRLVAVGGGVELVDEGSTVRTPTAAAVVVHGLSPADLDVAATLAVAREPVTAAEVDAGMFGPRSEAEVRLTARRLDHLVDCGILVRAGRGYDFRDPHTREAAERWLRPTRRHGLQHRFASCEELSPELRARQWVRLGEPEEAIALMLRAAQDATDEGLHDRAWHLLRYGTRLATTHVPTSQRGVGLVVQTMAALGQMAGAGAQREVGLQLVGSTKAPRAAAWPAHAAPAEAVGN